jgi:hypothetical protein
MTIRAFVSAAVKMAFNELFGLKIKSAIKLHNENEKRIVSSAHYLYTKKYNGPRVNGVDEKGPFSKKTDLALWARCLKEAV